MLIDRKVFSIRCGVLNFRKQILTEAKRQTQQSRTQETTGERGIRATQQDE